MKAIDKILDHYRHLPRNEVHVPEWDLTIYWTDLTAQEADRVLRESRGNQAEQAARLVELKAQDTEGNRLFEKGDALKLIKGASMAVLARVAGKMQEGLVNIEEAEKNF